MALRAPTPQNESERLIALSRYRILDTAPDEEVNDLARIAAYICKTPVSLVTLIDSNRQWFKAKFGPIAGEEGARDTSFCGHAMLADDLFIIPDAWDDPRFADNPAVIGTDGVPRVRFYAGAPLKDPSGNALGSLCVIDTIPRQLSTEQQNALRALSRQVVVAFELRRVGLELQEALRAKGEFLQIASHDLRNPLTVILASSAMLAQMLPPPAETKNEEDSFDSRGLAESIERQARAMKGLIENYLDVQAIEDGNIKFKLGAVDVAELLRHVVCDVGKYAVSKRTTVTLDVPENLPKALCDAGRVGQVLHNLVGNAIKFSPLESVVTIRAKHSHIVPANLRKTPSPELARANLGSILVEVADTGPGIASYDIPRLFTQHGKLSARPTGDEKSSGLGLAISRRLIKLQGGSIGVHNNVPPPGSTFWLTLPLAE